MENRARLYLLGRKEREFEQIKLCNFSKYFSYSSGGVVTGEVPQETDSEVEFNVQNVYYKVLSRSTAVVREEAEAGKPCWNSPSVVPN